MNRISTAIALSNILVDAFGVTGTEDTIDNYTVFVQEFAKEHDMKIYGGNVSGHGWSTRSFEFNNDEAEVFFKLKYGKLEFP